MLARRYALNAAFRDFGVGERFCVDWRPTGAAWGALLVLPPFGEELNKSRRAMACAAREFSTNGWFVRLVDAFGTGDSPGDFAAATWAQWVADYRAAASDLARETGLKVSFWGVRIGALIAQDVAAPGARLILWQPALSGEQQLTQLLRLRVTQESFSGSGQAPTTKQLRSMLERGEPLEIGGYELNPSLVLPMAERRIDALDAWKGTIGWLDTGPEPRSELPPATGRSLEALRERGVTVEYDHVVGQPFWATVEIETADGLAKRSLDMLRAVVQ
jgi:exosortase A-associated hydrolase 2